MTRKKILAYLYLPVVAVFPVLMGAYQISHFLNWLLDWNMDFSWMLSICPYSLFFLCLFFIISLYEHFCIYHRLVILSVVYCNLSCYFADVYPSILFYNITNILAVLLITAGIVGCAVHFGCQIKDFVRYVKTKR